MIWDFLNALLFAFEVIAFGFLLALFMAGIYLIKNAGKR